MDETEEYDVYASYEGEDGYLSHEFVGQLNLPATDDTNFWPIELEVNGITYAIKP